MLKKYSLFLIILLSSCADNTNNSEQKNEEVSVPNQNDDLKYLAQDFREKIYTPHENIKVAVGYGLANSILVWAILRVWLSTPWEELRLQAE